MDAASPVSLQLLIPAIHLHGQSTELCSLLTDVRGDLQVARPIDRQRLGKLCERVINESPPMIAVPNAWALSYSERTLYNTFVELLIALKYLPGPQVGSCCYWLSTG